MRNTRKPGLFTWERDGRAWTLHVGFLTARVESIGSKGRGDQAFRVREIFGSPFLASRARMSLDNAILEAERNIRDVAGELARAVEKASSTKRTAER
jgi:hypothetical protein